MLSAAGISALDLEPGMALSDLMSHMVGTDMVANPIEARHELRQEAVGTQSKASELIDFPKIGPPAHTPLNVVQSAIEATASLTLSSEPGTSRSSDATEWFGNRIRENLPGTVQPNSSEVAPQIAGTVQQNLIHLQQFATTKKSSSEITAVKEIDGRAFQRESIAERLSDDFDPPLATGIQRFSSTFVMPDAKNLLERDFDADQSQFLRQLRDNLRNPAGMEHDSIRVFSDPAGGFVNIQRIHSQTSPFSVDQFAAWDERLLEARPFVGFGQLGSLIDSESVGSIWSAYSMAKGPERLAETVMPDLLESPQSPFSDGEGGFVDVLVHDSVMLMDWSIDSFNRVPASHDQRAGSAPAGTSGIMEIIPSTETALKGSFATIFDTLDRFVPSAFGNKTEGGFVDLDGAPGTYSRLSGELEHNPALKPPWSSDKLESVDSIWRAIGDGSEPGTEARVTQDENRQAGRHSVGRNATEGTATRWALATNSEEGGMIELVAVDFAKTNSDRFSVASPELATKESSDDADEIRMDKGVALFQAFELATVPTQSGRETSDTPKEPKEVGAPVEAAVLTSTNDVPSPKQSASAERESGELDRRAAAMPSIISVAAVLSTVNGVWQEGPLEKRNRYIRTI